MRSVISVGLVVALAAACSTSETVEETIVAPPGDQTGPPVEEPAPEPAPPGLPPAPPEDPPEQPPENQFEECATQYDEAKLKPLDMVVMLDRSGSMADDGKWTATTSALQQFAANPDSDGIGVSMSYFPETYSDVCLPCDFYCAGVCFNGCCAPPTGEFCWDDGDCDSGGVCYDFMCHAGGGNATCEIGDYAAPDVPLTLLPGAAGELNISMANTSPAGGTPTGPALAGALSYAADLASQPDANDVVVVMATDGEPTECQPQAIGDVASIAAAAANAATSIPTFVIGVGANMFNLNVIAAAGGTTQAYLVDADANATKNFLSTLNEIRKVAVACHYEIPEIEGGGMIAYNLVNVTFAADGQPFSAIGQVSGATACGTGGGWYYDDPATPTAIVMCPSTCEQLQGSAGTQVEIVYGCETIIN